MLLLFHIEETKRQQLAQVCTKLQIETVDVPTRDYLQKLGALAKISGFIRTGAVYRGAEFPEEMLVFGGMDSDAVDAFLDACRAANLEPVARKAVLTATNLFWTPLQLYRELGREAAALS